MFQPRALVFLAVLSGLSGTPALAASIQTISPSQCVWHPGDNPAWSAPAIDETGWKPLATWKVTADQPWAWIRCHADLPTLQQASHPALEVKTARAYQLFLNGSLIAQNGNLSNGQTSMNPEQTFPVAPHDLASSTDTIALRIKSRISIGNDGNETGPAAFDAGEADWLRARHKGDALARAMPYLPVVIGFGIVAVMGFVLLALYLNDRSHLELLLLAFACWAMATARICEICRAAMVPAPSSVGWLFYGLSQSVVFFEIWFMFRLAHRKVPLFYKICAAETLSLVILCFSNSFFPVHISLWIVAVWQKWGPIDLIVGALGYTAPFAAFWPWRTIPRGTRALAVCAMFWGIVDIGWLLYEALTQFTMGTVVTPWTPIFLEVRSFGILSAIIALVALLFREQRRTAEERAVLAGEMQAAQQIQRILAPASVDTAAGVRVEVAFRPMRDVGGDFYLCRALPDGRQRVLVGDVSGKGAAAAMTATLLIGAAEGRDADSPAHLLSHLNRVLYTSQVGGFATCLCADLEPNGRVTLANAGHLSPYCRGKEIPIAPGLPLGLSPSHGIYDELRLHLAEGETLTFLSDGVVEARSATGELFGFERTQAMSAHTASAIAEAAEKYGQQDDITVLTLTRTQPTPESVMAVQMA